MTIREQSEPAKIIVLLNNYDMREAKRLIDRGEMPGQHLWGCGSLPKGWVCHVPRASIFSVKGVSPRSVQSCESYYL